MKPNLYLPSIVGLPSAGVMDGKIIACTSFGPWVESLESMAASSLRVQHAGPGYGVGSVGGNTPWPVPLFDWVIYAAPYSNQTNCWNTIKERKLNEYMNFENTIDDMNTWTI